MRERMQIAAGKPGEFFTLSFLHKPLFADAEQQSAGVSLRRKFLCSTSKSVETTCKKLKINFEGKI
jgi:hypothetical protein